MSVLILYICVYICLFVCLFFSAPLLVFQLLTSLFSSVLVSSRCTHTAYCLPSLFGMPYFLFARGTPGLSHSRVLCELKDEEQLGLIYLFLREQCAPPFSSDILLLCGTTGTAAHPKVCSTVG